MWHLENFSDEKLQDIVENYARYKYDKSVKFEAEAILKKRGVVLHKEESVSATETRDKQAAKDFMSEYKFRSMVTFAILVALILVQFLVNSYSMLALFGLLLLVYIIMIFICYSSHSSYYRTLHRTEEKAPLFLFIILGFLFFPIYSIYQANRMGKALKT